MKKLFLLLIVMIIGVSGIAFGQVTEQLSDTATLSLSGSVPQYVAISIASNGVGENLDLGSAETTAFEVATVTEAANTPFIVSASSANGFTLQHATETSYNVAYTLLYGGTDVAANSAAVVTGVFGEATTRSIEMTHEAAIATDPAGNYTDTVTFTISTN